MPYILILVTALAAGTANTVIGKFPSKQDCAAAAKDAQYIPGTGSRLGYWFFCVKNPN